MPAAPSVLGPGGPSIAGNQYLTSSVTDAAGNCAAYLYDSNANPTTIWSGLASTGTGSSRSCAAPSGSPPSGAVKTVVSYQGDQTPGGGGGGTVSCGAQPGEACSTTDGNGGVTSYGYNNAGEVTTVTPPAPAGSTTVAYDTVGRVSQVTDGSGRTVAYTYNNADQVTVADYNPAGDPNCTSPADCVTSTYDADGNLTARTGPTGTSTYTYDTLGRLVSQTAPGGVSRTCGATTDTAIHYTYNPAGTLASYCDQNGTVGYTYDAANRLVGVADPGGSCAPGQIVQPCTTYAYDAAGRRTATVFPTQTGVTETVGYNNAGDTTSIVAARTGVATPIVSLAYTYTTAAAPGVDTAQVASATDQITGTTTSYAYDTLDRLTCATTAALSQCGTAGYAYSYDNNGNITTTSLNGTTTTASFNAANQNTAGAYDAAGNQTALPDGTTLAYNPLSQTATVTTPGQAADTYTYSGAGQAGLTQTGPTTLQSSRPEGVTATNTTGTETAYTRTPTGALNTLRTGGQDYYYITDTHGTVLALIDTNGNTAATYTYTPYGAPTNTPTSIGAVNPFRYNSGYTTPNGLIHYGARYYNPTTATWTQLDPTGQTPGYTYAGDNPVNNVDLSGASLFGTILGVTAGVLGSAAFIVGAITTAPLVVGVLGSTAFAVGVGALACTLISC